MCAHIIITMFSLCVCVSTRPEAAGPLDLRFDSSNGVPASKLLSLLSRSQLERILIDGGEDDEIAARRIADAVALTNDEFYPPVPDVALRRPIKLLTLVASL